jgi:hypothetical protein
MSDTKKHVGGHVVQSLPMDRLPIWTEVSKDGRWAWVTSAQDNNVVKVERSPAAGPRDRVVARHEQRRQNVEA